MANRDHIAWLREGVESWNARREQDNFRPDFDGANLPALLQGQSYDPGSIYLGTSLEGINLQKAFLRGANLSGLSLVGADFTDAQLKGSSLASADLSSATLPLADLSDTVLLMTNFSAANAAGANFSGANLSGACLDNANLRQAIFSRASFVSASIENADLRGAVLAGADLSSTQPWRARLFDDLGGVLRRPSSLPDNVRGVAELLEIADGISQHYSTRSQEYDIESPVLYFRGEAFYDWELRPSAARTPAIGQPDIRAGEGEILLDLMSRKPQEFSQMASALSQWVLAQHHGLKTRLLDVTRNPLVAFFAACEDPPGGREFGGEDGVLHILVVPRQMIKPFNSDSISIIANFAKLPFFEQEILLGKRENIIRENLTKFGRKPPIGFYNKYDQALVRLYHHIGGEKPHFRERIDPKDLFRVFVVEPAQSFERVRAQSGAFLVSAFHQRFEPNRILEWNDDIPVYDHYKFKVPAPCKQSILRELLLLNVTRETLYPGLDEATRAVMQRYTR